jgi:hypothetical protein
MRADERARAEERAIMRPRLAAALGPTFPVILIILVVGGGYVHEFFKDPPGQTGAGMAYVLVGLILFAALLFYIMWERENRLPHAGDTFALQCRGEYLAPSYFRKLFLAEEMEAGTVPQDGQILPGPLETYKFDPNDNEPPA